MRSVKRKRKRTVIVAISEWETRQLCASLRWLLWSYDERPVRRYAPRLVRVWRPDLAWLLPYTFPRTAARYRCLCIWCCRRKVCRTLDKECRPELCWFRSVCMAVFDFDAWSSDSIEWTPCCTVHMYELPLRSIIVLTLYNLGWCCTWSPKLIVFHRARSEGLPQAVSHKSKADDSADEVDGVCCTFWYTCHLSG